MNADEKVIKARARMIAERPFFAWIILGLELRSDPSCRTGWTDGRSLAYCPEWIENLHPEMIFGFLAHEVMHLALLHHLRRRGRIPRLWNIATDLVINAILQAEGFRLVDDGDWSPFLDFRAEDIYEWLLAVVLPYDLREFPWEKEKPPRPAFPPFPEDGGKTEKKVREIVATRIRGSLVEEILSSRLRPAEEEAGAKEDRGLLEGGLPGEVGREENRDECAEAGKEGESGEGGESEGRDGNEAADESGGVEPGAAEEEEDGEGLEVEERDTNEGMDETVRQDEICEHNELKVEGAPSRQGGGGSALNDNDVPALSSGNSVPGNGGAERSAGRGDGPLRRCRPFGEDPGVCVPFAGAGEEPPAGRFEIDRGSRATPNAVVGPELPGGGEEDSDPCGSGEVRDLPDGEGKPLSERDRQAEEDGWKESLKRAAARSQGDVPLGLERRLGGWLAARLDWKSLLARFLLRELRADYSWEAPNPRYLPSGVYIPAFVRVKSGTVVVAVDTSGSLSDDDLEALFSECRGIAAVENVEVVLVTADCEVKGSETISRWQCPDIFSGAGGGGTDYRPVFKWVGLKHLFPRCLVYLTDGWCDRFPADVPEYPVLWAVGGKRMNRLFRAPWGEIVRMM